MREERASVWFPAMKYSPSHHSHILDGHGGLISESDLAFFQRLVARTIAIHGPHIMALTQSKTPAIPSAEMALAIDFIVSPPTMEILSLEELSDRLGTPHTQSHQMIEQCRASEGRMMLTRSTISSGYTRNMPLALVSRSPLWDTKPLPNGRETDDVEIQANLEWMLRETRGYLIPDAFS